MFQILTLPQGQIRLKRQKKEISCVISLVQAILHPEVQAAAHLPQRVIQAVPEVQEAPEVRAVAVKRR